jgi:predicted phage baseplate assembly protein
MDNERTAWLRFGDGTHGAPPPPAVSFRARYRVGNAAAGNVGADTITHAVWPSNVSGQIESVRNPLAARGGIEPQPIRDVKLFAPQTFRQRLERAVTAEDYAAIAQREFPGEVQRAVAALRWNGSWYEALVAIDAFGSSGASPELLARVRRRLRTYRRIGHDLRVDAATRVPVHIALSVCIKATYLRAHVLADLQSAFSDELRADGQPGFFHPDRLTFGAALYLSQVISAAQSVPGVMSVRATTFERMFEGPRGEIDRGYIAFGLFEIAQCDSDPTFPEHGRIEFSIGGGR